MKKVFFLDTVHPILFERLTQSDEYECIDAHDWTRKQCENQLSEAYGIVIRSRFTMDEPFLQFTPTLQFIARSGAGMENIDEAYCVSREIQLYNAPEGNRNAVGEHALGMLLSMMKKIHTANRDVKNGIWDREGNRGVELDGKTVGIIGFGNNGKAFAKKLRGFDITLLAYDKYKTGFGDDFVIEATLEALLRKSDVISFHIPQNEETIHFANQEFFDALGKPIYLLNLSRGKIVETNSLIESIRKRTTLSAGLDVNEFEKKSFENFFEDSENEALKFLLESDRILLTPHVGGWTEESYYKLSSVLADKILEVED